MTTEQAINELKDWKTAFSHMAHMDKDMSYAIEALSMAIEAISAQPEPSWDCEKCMMEHTDEMEKLEAELAIAKSKQPEPCEDAISRQAEIEIVNRYDKSHMVLKQRPMLGAASIVIELEDLPSAQPERKMGKWIDMSEDYGDYDYKCSICGSVQWNNTDFCPDCGADMRGV